MQMSKTTAPIARIDYLLTTYEKLNREANDLLDLATAELVAERPGIPAGVLKQREFTSRAGSMLNFPEALRILREKFS
jgi:hypothetical protein